MGTQLEIAYDGNSTLGLYTAGAEEAPRGILVLHEWWGVKPHNRAWADRLAAELGCRAAVVDLYDGRVTDDVEQATAWMKAIDQAVADRKLRAALAWMARPGRRVGVYGCSFGGREAMAAALLEPDRVDAVVVAYSRMVTEPTELKRLRAPVLAIYAEQERAWPQKQRDFESAMAAAGKITESVCYDAAHGFSNPESARYDQAADEASWREILAFFERRL